MEAIDRFLAKVEWGDNRYEGTRCLLWTGAKINGYGTFRVSPRRSNSTSHRAHRWLYERWIGPIPGGAQLDHLCHTTECHEPAKSCPHRACVNPSHLAPSTQRENILRGNSFSAVHARKTHCPQGHEYTEENTRMNNGSRICRTCKRDHDRRYRARQSQ